MVLLVAPEFLNDTVPVIDAHNELPVIGFNVTGSSLGQYESIVNATEIASTLQSNQSSLTHFENAECIRTYGTDFVTNFLNVLLVTNGSHTLTGSILAGYEYHPAPTSSESSVNDILKLDWICNGVGNCDIPNQIDQASTWSYNLKNQESTRVSYCLAQRVDPKCTVEILPQVLIIVIVCNVLKAICFTTLLKRKFTPLIILGDAIASFMTHPDPNMHNSGPLSAESIRKAYIVEPLRFSTQRRSQRWEQNRPSRRVTQWHPARRRWASAVGQKRWIFTVLG